VSEVRQDGKASEITGRICIEMVNPVTPKQLEMKILDKAFCETLFLPDYEQSNQMCAARRTPAKLNQAMGSLCHGDSGSPLICKNGDQQTQEGIVSWGHMFCSAPVAVFTRVSNFVPWINEQIQSLSYCSK